jgi:hypothetical protein
VALTCMEPCTPAENVPQNLNERACQFLSIAWLPTKSREHQKAAERSKGYQACLPPPACMYVWRMYVAGQGCKRGFWLPLVRGSRVLCVSCQILREDKEDVVLLPRLYY